MQQSECFDTIIKAVHKHTGVNCVAKIEKGCYSVSYSSFHLVRKKRTQLF